MKFDLSKENIKQHSPEILFVGGVIASIAAIVTACKSSKKAPAVIEKAKNELEVVHNQELEGREKGIALAKTYLKIGGDFAMLYGPAVVTEAVALGCFGKSFQIMKNRNIELEKRNVELGATLLTVSEGFRRYRDNVIERFGEEVDYELEHGIHKEEIEVEEEDPKTGKIKKVKKEVSVSDPAKAGKFVKYFTKINPYWDDISDVNSVANDKYIEDFFGLRLKELDENLSGKRYSKKDPYVTLNDAYEAFGFERENDGYVPRWKYDFNGGMRQIDIFWRKTKIPNAEGNLEEVWELTFNPTCYVV